MPLRRFRVKFADGTSEIVKADSLDEATAKARRSARKQISVGRQGRKQVESVKLDDAAPSVPGGGGRCGARHGVHGNVKCEEPKGHSGDHYNSFYARKWE
jgi:hypothetical protein